MDRRGEGIDLIVNSADGVRVRIDRSLLDA
jgi:hypothetical protein